MFKSKLLNTLILAGFSAMPVVAMAEPAKAAVPTIGQILDASGVSVTGYLDFGYTSLNATGQFGGPGVVNGGGPSRVFDAPNSTTGKNFSSFNLNQASITVAKAPKEGFGGVINLIAGQDANVFASYGAGAVAAGSTNPYLNNHSIDAMQAYGSYAGGALTVISGKFTSLAGAEVIASASDTNASRSILFGYAVPYTHTGVRATYAATDTVSVIAGVNNGWDQVADMNTDKTIELGFTAAPSKMLSLAGVYYAGNELAGGVTALPALTSNGNRQLLNLVATVTATEQLSFIVEYDTASQDNATLANGTTGTAKWDGLAAYANFQINDQWRTSLRSEYMNDKDGYKLPFVGTAGQKWSESTLTLAYLPTTSFEVRGEVRSDSSTQNVFLSSDGTAKSSQTSVGLEALYKY